MWRSTKQDASWSVLKLKLASKDSSQRQEVLLQIKDAVIGSNKQKGALISHGLVLSLLEICSNKNEDIHDKIHALTILGSLAKGSAEQVRTLIVDYNIIPLLIKHVILDEKDSKCIEACLITLRSLYEHPEAPIDAFATDSCSLTYFLSFASAENSIKTQICVISILVSLCRTFDDQIRLLNAGTINVLARMICYGNEQLQIPALRLLSCMCFCNRSVADNICVTSYQGRSLPDILNSLMSRLFSPDIQLTAARCLSYIYRSGTLFSTDQRIVQKTLPSLSRLCSDNFECKIRVEAAETLSYLIEIDSELQRTAAISNYLLKSLSELLNSTDPATKRAALKCFASLAANDEAIRKRIVDMNGVINAILDGLNDTNAQVKLASVKCLHSLSRSVQQLRTTFQDHAVWEPLMSALSNEQSGDLVLAILSIVCNLILEFSPSKEALLSKADIIKKLCQFTSHSDPALRLNSVWALMNMSFQAEQRIKLEIINKLGMSAILKLLCDIDTKVLMKTLGLLRNLFSNSEIIEYVFREHGSQLMQAVNSILELNQSSEIKEQVLCVIGYIAAEAQEDYITNNPTLMLHLRDNLLQTDAKLQAGALFVIKNILHRKESFSVESYSRLIDIEIISKIHELGDDIIIYDKLCDDYIQRTLKDILMQCKHFSSDNKSMK